MATARASKRYLLLLSQISDSLQGTDEIQPPKKDDSCRTKSDKRYNWYIKYLDNVYT